MIRINFVVVGYMFNVTLHSDVVAENDYMKRWVRRMSKLADVFWESVPI